MRTVRELVFRIVARLDVDGNVDMPRMEKYAAAVRCDISSPRYAPPFKYTINLIELHCPGIDIVGKIDTARFIVPELIGPS